MHKCTEYFASRNEHSSISCFLPDAYIFEKGKAQIGIVTLEFLCYETSGCFHPLSFNIECVMIKSVHGALSCLQLYHCNMFINLTLCVLVGRCYRKIITSTYLLPNYTFSEHSWASTRTKKVN